MDISIFSKIQQFSDLPDAIKEELVSHAVLCQFDAGQMIYLEGEPGERLFFLEEGWIKAVRLSREGREQAMMFLRSGEIFGDIAVYSGRPYPCTVTALEPVKAWAVEKCVMDALIARYPELASAVVKRLAERVLHYVGLVEDLGLRSVEARLANTLLRYAEARGEVWVVQRRTWATFEEMAVRLGTVRDVLARVLRTLEAEGLLRVDRSEIVILDRKGLEERGRA